MLRLHHPTRTDRAGDGWTFRAQRGSPEGRFVYGRSYLERPKQGALDGSAVREGLAAVTILTKAGPEKYRLDDGAS